MMLNAVDADRFALLNEPLSIGALLLPNRIAMAPMTREFAPSGVLVAGAEDYYAARASGGAGLIITEGTAVDHAVAHHSNRVPHFYGDAALARWQAVAEAVHAAGSRIFPQLWHTGLYRQTAQTDNPEMPNIAPSQVGNQPTRAMTDEDIADVIAAFATAASEAKRIGMDGVAIHGAHGYLLDQFLWTRTNKRDDAFGGPIERRVRFAVELIRRVRQAVGPDYPIMLRFSQWKGTFYGQELASKPQDLEPILIPLADAGVDIFDASMRRFWLPEFDGSPLNLAGWAKKITGKAAMAVGSVGLEDPLQMAKVEKQPVSRATLANLGMLLEMMGRGDFDLIAIGRALLANPRWPQLVQSGAYDRLRPFDAERVARLLEPAEDA